MYRLGGETGIAALSDSGFRGISRETSGYPGDLDSLVATGVDLVETGKLLLTAPRLDTAGLDFLPPLSRPSKILCVGLNYRDHSVETGMKLPDYPTIFARFPSCLVGHGQPILKPRVSEQLDYEGELAAVIGTRAFAVPEDRALEHVAAYSLFNDASVRDYQMRTTQWTLGKNFDGTGAFGPVLVTPDELPPGAIGLRIVTRLNGSVVQDASTADMVFGVASLISILSQVMTLEPGDVLVTGTPSGVGMARKPPLYMKSGDVCEVEIEGVGVLRNPVAKA